MTNPQEDPTMMMCPCTVGAVHTAWNCPTCKGKGWIKKSNHVAEISQALDEMANDPKIRTRSMRDRIQLQRVSAQDLSKKITV